MSDETPRSVPALQSASQPPQPVSSPVAPGVPAQAGRLTPVPPLEAKDRVVDKQFLIAARLPFSIALLAVVAIIAVMIYRQVLGYSSYGAIESNDPPIVRFLIPNAIYIGLFIIALSSGYIGYRLIVAAGATTTAVIPQQDYALLAPLIADGKAESIDQYVRLSSLGTFTGRFTQIGLTGLPLATIGLTLFFSVVAIFHSEGFLDLTKLTLGAFIGSFVQRQVERRSEGATAREHAGEAVTPTHVR
jgi:hypothetical protein